MGRTLGWELDIVRDFPIDCVGKSPFPAVPLFEHLSKEGNNSCHCVQSPSKTARKKGIT